jgi:peptidoglycan/LPS O-acetylase OafA/YrhL
MSEPALYFRGLNGLRAVAALSVVVSHINMSFRQFNLDVLRTTNLAGFGVTIFFSISGFLITYLLIREKEIKPIDIKKFYVRRILRIWPLYFFVLGLTLITEYYFFPGALPGTLPFYIFLAANIPFIMGSELPLLGHYWSLGVEEQFYLFWPFLIKHSKRILFAISIFTAVYVLLRLIARVIDYKTGFTLPYIAVHVTRFDCMAIGGIGAVLFHQGHALFRKIAFHMATQVLCWIVIGLLMFNRFHLASVIDPEIVSAVTVILILNLSQNPRTLIRLDYPVFDFIGKISYGIYMMHVLIIFYLGKATKALQIESGLKYVLIYISVIGSSILLAWLTYTFFEKPFLKLKKRFSVVKSTMVEKEL